MTMGERLRELRQARGLSLQQAATPIGCSKPHLWEIESGTSANPSLDLLRKLAAFYGVSVGHIIGDGP